MFFKLEQIAVELELHPESLEAEFTCDAPDRVSVRLRCPTPDEKVQVQRPDFAVGTTVLEREPSEKVRAMFESLANNVLPGATPELADSVSYVDRDGRIAQDHVVGLSLLPPALQQFVDNVVAEMDDRARRTVHIVRWRCGGQGPHSPLGTRGLGREWSFDGRTWHPLPLDTRAEMLPSRRIEVTTSTLSAVM